MPHRDTIGITGNRNYASKAKKKDWQYEYYRCTYCKHSGEWVTIYVRCEGFKSAVDYMQGHLDVWIIKEISWNLANGELIGKLIEGQDLGEPTILYPDEPPNPQQSSKL